MLCLQLENAWRSIAAKPKLSTSEQMICSFVGGGISAIVTIPLDVVVATMQQAAKAGEVGLVLTMQT